MNGLPIIAYDNRFADAVPVPSGTAAGDFNVLYLNDFRAYTWFKFDALPGTIRVNGPAAKKVNYIYVAGHDLGTQGSTLELHASSDDFAAVDITVGTWSPTDDKDFVALVTEVNYQDYEWRVSGATIPIMAILIAGERFEFPKAMPKGFDPLGRKVIGHTNKSQKGHPLGKIIDYEEWRENIRVRQVSWDWVRNTFLPAWDAQLKGKPFGFAWDPVDHGKEVYLVTSDGSFKTPHKQGTFASFNLPVSGRVS